MSENVTTLVYTAITVLFSGAAWKFYESKMKSKAQKDKDNVKMITCTEMILELGLKN